MQALSQKFIRVARWVGLVLIAIAAWSVPAAVAAPPQITVSPEPPTGWLSSGEYPITVSAAGGEYDIHSLEWRLEGGPVTWFTKLCAVVKEPCPKQASATGVLRPAELPDGVWDLVVGVKYSPVRVGNFLSTGEVTRRFRLMVDHDAPSPPTGLALAGGDGWRSTNRFDVHWTPFAPDGGTSIVGSDYRICRASNPPRSDIGCITGRRYGSAVDGIAGISVPGTGVWRLEVALRDELGHVNLDAGATIPELRFDADAPRLAFLARSASDPARVQLSATDEGSGLRSVEIEARRQGEKSWRALSVSAHEGSLTALLDDDDLPAGKYEIRGHAVDAVGNERSIGLENAELIELPVRQASKLSAGKPTAGRKGGTKLDPRPSIPFAARVQLRGRVTDAFGTGRARVNVEVLERLAMPGVAWRPLTTIRTDENGSFRYTAPQSMARTVRFQYAGTPTTRAAGAEVALRVRAASTLRPSRRSLRNGEAVVLRGRLLGRPIPASGKLVTVQAWTPRGWLTFGNARARAKDGKWSYRYTFTGTSTTSRYRFRALVTQEESYPYVTGTSPVRAVMVQGSG